MSRKSCRDCKKNFKLCPCPPNEALILSVATDDFMAGLTTDDGYPWLNDDLLTALKKYASGACATEITTNGSDLAFGLMARHTCQGALLLCLAMDTLPPQDKKALKLALKQETPDFKEILSYEMEEKLIGLLPAHIFASRSPRGDSSGVCLDQ